MSLRITACGPRTAIVFVFCSVFMNTASAGGTDPKPKTKASSCAASLVSSSPVRTLDSVFHQYTLAELVSGDPSSNLAIKFPAMLMDAAQKTWLQIGRESREIREPTFRVRNVRIYPALAEGGTMTGGHKIVGHYEAMSNFVEHARQGDGRRIPLATGGPGTGKTALLTIATETRARLSDTNPDFMEMTYQWKGLDKIPTLKDAANPDGTREAQIKRSPITLLPPETQAKVVAFATEAFEKKWGVKPRPFLSREPQAAEIIAKIMAHTYGERGKPPTEEEYVATLSQYVTLVKRDLDPGERPGLVTFQGKDPAMSDIFVSRNLVLGAIYGPHSALSYDYSGIVPRADGGIICLDELPRQPQAFRDHALGLIQDHRVDFGGAPSVELDILVVAAANDESLDAAKTDSAAGALLDRSKSIPMRASVHPMQVASLTLYERWKQGTRFVQWPLTEKGAVSSEVKVSPSNFLELYPIDPGPDGLLKGPESRFGIAALEDNGSQTLIAPHALSLIAATAAATRLVTNPAALQMHPKDFDVLGGGSHFYTDPATRIEVILGITPAEAAVRRELETANVLLSEGEGGISARQVDIWFEAALTLGRQVGAVTPTVVTKAFQRLLDLKSLGAVNPKERVRWIDIHNLIKERLSMPAIAADVNAILSGDPKRVDRIYDEVRREIIALSNDPQARTYQSAEGERVPINLDRLLQIEEIYERINHRPLVREEIRNFHVNFEGSSDTGLRRVIHDYVLQSAINVDGLSDIIAALSGKPHTPDAERRVVDAMRGMNQLGYNKVALTEALRFMRDLQLERQKRK